MKKRIKICDQIASVLEITAFCAIILAMASLDRTPFLTCIGVFTFGLICAGLAFLFEDLKKDFSNILEREQERRRVLDELIEKAEKRMSA